ncbi:G-protein coupled receptor [Leptinotarsa decemlineata]|uniref:G-protein coupled receptor n=1 Tax=Leptinotarsa decemlineata TaxID=7539 RepID=UPI003D30B8B6
MNSPTSLTFPNLESANTELFFEEPQMSATNGTFGCCCCSYDEKSCATGAMNFVIYLNFIHMYYIPVVIVVGFVGNVLSCLVLLTTHLKLRSSSYYLAALAVADTGYVFCIFVVYCTSNNIFDIFNKNGFCQVLMYLTYVCSFLSVWLIVAFTVERFIAVQYPLKKPYICTVSRAKIIVLSLTAVALIFHFYIFLIVNIVEEQCQLVPEYQKVAGYINYVDTILTLVVPVVLIVGMNTMIAISLFRFRKKMQDDIGENRADSEPTGFYNTSNSQSTSSTKKSRECHSLQDMEVSEPKKTAAVKNNYERRQYSRIHVKKSARHGMSIQIQHNINKMLLVISSVFIALNLPSYLLRICVYFEEIIYGDFGLSYFECIQQFAMVLYYTNFSINFLLYTMCGETFRLCLRTLFKDIFRKLSSFRE